jgi:uncharacterized protein (TIGR02246 family)
VTFLPFPPYPPGDVAAIDDVRAARHLIEVTYPTVANSGDADAYAALYAPDALWSPPDALDRHGPAQIRFGYIAKNADIDALMHAEEVRVIADFAYVTAVARVHVVPRTSGLSTTHFYRGLWLLQRMAGVWKISRQIWTVKPAGSLAALFEHLASQRRAQAN